MIVTSAEPVLRYLVASRSDTYCILSYDILFFTRLSCSSIRDTLASVIYLCSVVTVSTSYSANSNRYGFIRVGGDSASRDEYIITVEISVNNAFLVEDLDVNIN